MSHLSDYANTLDDERYEAAKAAYLAKLAEILEDPVQITECLTGQYTMTLEESDRRLSAIAEQARAYMLSDDTIAKHAAFTHIGVAVMGMLVPDMDHLCRDYAEAEWLDYAERELVLDELEAV